MSNNKGAYSSLKGVRRAVPIILLAVAVFVALCFITPDTGALGRAIANVLLGLFAGAAYAIPFVIATHALFYASDVQEKRVVTRIIFSAVALIALSAFIYTVTSFGDELVFSAKDFYNMGKEARGGGFIGGSVGFAIIKIFGTAGLIIIALLVLALYVSYFFAKGRGAAKKSLYVLFMAVASVLAVVEKGVYAVIGFFKKQKQNKIDKLQEAKTEELYDDEYFAVDSGLSELSIPALGIHEARSHKSIEENPTLHEKIHHKSEAPKTDGRRTVDTDYGMGGVSPRADSRADRVYSDDFREIRTNVRSERTERDTRDERAERLSYGLDCNASDIFTKDFNPIDFVSSEDEATRPSSRGPKNIARQPEREVTESVRAISERDVEMARRKADFDMKKRAAIEAMHREEENAAVKLDSVSTERKDYAKDSGSYSETSYRRASEFISEVNAEYTKTVMPSVDETAYSSIPEKKTPEISYTAPESVTPEASYTAPESATPEISYTAPESVTPEISYTAPESATPEISYEQPEERHPEVLVFDYEDKSDAGESISVSRAMLNPTSDTLVFDYKSEEEEAEEAIESSAFEPISSGVELIIDDAIAETVIETVPEVKPEPIPQKNMYTYSEDLGNEEEDEEEEPPFEVDTPPLPEKKAPAKKKRDYSDYKYPPIDILTNGTPLINPDAREEMEENGNKIIETLASFNVLASIKGYDRGPRITRYEIVPAKGVRVQQVVNLFDDIALNLAADGIRIEAPIPGKSAIGFELPNKKPETVRLRDLLECDEFKNAPSKTIACIGKDVTGTPVFGDIAKMPHVLIAGATGMGKSVCINSILLSILYKARPDEVKFILIDPKKVEFKPYNGVPHLLVPVVSEPKQAAGALMWAVEEMERRYDMIEKECVRNIEAYNEKVAQNPKIGDPMPKIIIVIDELNDLMLQVRDPVEGLIMSIAQKARAAGIHLIIGTQRPSVNVITGVIKANIPSRMSCKVASYTDSKTILERAGAERLLDKGDMLYFPVGTPQPKRVQSAFVSDHEVEKVMEALKLNASGNDYDDQVMEDINRAAQKCVKEKRGGGEDRGGAGDGGGSDGGGYLNDQQFLDAVDLAVSSGKISTSLIQRRVGVGYGKAAKFIDIMEDMGIVSAPNGQKPRDTLISRDEWMEKLSRLSLD